MSQEFRSDGTGKETLSLFIALNVNNDDYPPWLHSCVAPRCSYQIFGDRAKPDTVAYSSGIESGYGNFGFRGRFQMDWALKNVKFTYFLRVDEDGFLCVDALLRELDEMPRVKFIMGRFHCDRTKARMDENFMLLSRDIVNYYAKGWETGTLPFHGESTLALNIGSQLSRLWHEESWTFRDEPNRIRWDESFGIADVCTQYFWMHHLNSMQIRNVHVALNKKSGDMRKSTRDDHFQQFFNSTACGWNDSLPAFENLDRVAYSRGKRGSTLYHDFRPRGKRPHVGARSKSDTLFGGQLAT